MNEFRFQIENQINPNLLTSVSIQNFPGLKGKLPKFISNKSTNIETLVLKGVQLGTRIVKDNNTTTLHRLHCTTTLQHAIYTLHHMLYYTIYNTV